MKKLKLSLQNIEGAEVLTRAQLKKVLGGNEDDGSGGKKCSDSCDGRCDLPGGNEGKCHKRSYDGKCFCVTG